MFWVLGMGDKTKDCPTELSAPSLPAPLTATPPPTGSQALAIVDSEHWVLLSALVIFVM